MALKPKAKSFELDILSEAEVAMERIKPALEPRVEGVKATWVSPMSKWHAGVDIEALPAMTDEECVLFDSLRQRGTYVVVIKKGRKYYLEDASGGVDPNSKPLKTRLVNDLIGKGWLAKSVRDDYAGYFVTSHMVFGWRKRIGV